MRMPLDEGLPLPDGPADAVAQRVEPVRHPEKDDILLLIVPRTKRVEVPGVRLAERQGEMSESALIERSGEGGASEQVNELRLASARRDAWPCRGRVR